MEEHSYKCSESGPIVSTKQFARDSFTIKSHHYSHRRKTGSEDSNAKVDPGPVRGKW